MSRAQIAHPKLLTSLCIGLGLLLVVEMFVWLLCLMVAYSPAYGVPSEGQDIWGRFAALMGVLDFCAVFGLVVRSVAVRSRAFTAMAVAHAVLLAYVLVLGVLGRQVVVAAIRLGLIVGYCAAIRRAAPVLER
ncbi:hypothetical protein GCM10023205_60980 [Yinghuangia aomiensis]|uniref:Integral membrane protein n=1 Tax=Yinghuangia aomiensis TaxID=676205 RepID=A0ABP9I0A7_9ACTN